MFSSKAEQRAAMSHAFEFEVTAPFAVGDLVADVDLEDGSTARIVLREGRFSGSLDSRPIRARLTEAQPPAGEASLVSASDADGTPAGTPVEVHELFEHGVKVPADGRLGVCLLWAAHCHDPAPRGSGEGRLFNSDEHIACARHVGLAAAADDAPPLVVAGVEARFRWDTPLPVGDARLTFGEIICLAGDFFAHLDEEAKDVFAPAWPALQGFTRWLGGDYRGQTLAGEAPHTIAAILQVIRRGSPAGAIGEYAALAYDGTVNSYPVRRYLALASQNYCHFANHSQPGAPDPANEALSLYLRYHRRALAEAAAAGGLEAKLGRALATEAFGCHFLTDAFASGHMRVPRRYLGERFGILRGALKMSRDMHAEDNDQGLWVTPRRSSRPRVVWRAYGDGRLLAPEAATHLAQVREAVRRSAGEVFAAFALRRRDPPWQEPAIDLVPVPLAPGESPRAGDVPPKAAPTLARGPNPFPLFWLDAAGVLWRRTGDASTNAYRMQEGGATVPARALEFA